MEMFQNSVKQCCAALRRTLVETGGCSHCVLLAPKTKKKTKKKEKEKKRKKKTERTRAPQSGLRRIGVDPEIPKETHLDTSGFHSAVKIDIPGF